MAHTFDERLIVNKDTKKSIIYNEHLIRYGLAKKFVKGKIVLDIACGSGYGAKILAGAGARKVVAVDIDQQAINSAKENYYHKNIEYTAGDAEKIRKDSKTFDVVVSFETIEHLKNPDKFLSEISRVIKDEGLAIISTPNQDVSHEKNPFHFHEFRRNEFESIISKHFKRYKILEQNNGIASCIAPENKLSDRTGEIIITENGCQPIYFIAVCSKSSLSDKLNNNFDIISVNFGSLQNLYNNIGMKIADKIYSIAIKIPGVKKLLGKIK